MRALARELGCYLAALVAMWPGASGDRLRLWWIARRVAEWHGESIGAFCRFENPERMRFGRRVSIGSGSLFTAAMGGNIVVADRVSFNTNVHINAAVGGTIYIGNDCLIGPNVVFRTASHSFARTDVPIREQGHEIGDIRLEDDVWLGANVVVLGSVTIGRGAVVAAGAVVTRDVPPMVLAAGVPAKILKSRGAA